MERHASDFLQSWLASPGRLPLVVRGARQVGKTWLVRDLARRAGLNLIELNFERDPAIAAAFDSNDPRRILGNLGLALGRELGVEGSLLFLDEIQAAGALLAKLRWFAEELPELPVIAAGSLLEFTLADHDFSMPVGRVSYLHVGPLSFPEYLRAVGQAPLLDALSKWSWHEVLSKTALDAAKQWFARYGMVGGMPAVVEVDRQGADASELRRRQHDLVATYLADFGKYAPRTDPSLLVATMRSIARQLGGKFVYSAVSEGTRSEQGRRALELLARARVCHIVQESSGNAVPLGGEVRSRSRKVVLLDVGLAHALIGTPATQVFPRENDLAPGIRGALAEQVLGQQLLTLAAPWEEPQLYYWQRGGGRPGEVDYLAQLDTRIVPLEGKAGATGSLKSLHQFMHDKRLDLAVRCDTNAPSIQDLELKTTRGEPVSYRLVTLPPFLIWRLSELVMRGLE